MHSPQLDGLSVLIPRGGKAGSRIASRLARHGVEGIIAPVMRFAPPDDREALRDAVGRLREGHYDWLGVTSGTAAEVLGALEGSVPSTTKVAAIGPVTANALRKAGLRVDVEPEAEFTAEALLEVWPEGTGRVLLPHSELASPTLAEGLRARGFTVDEVVAYRVLPVELDPSVRDEIMQGRIRAALVTSGSIARELSRQLDPVPSSLRFVCIGESSASAANSAGLRVDAVARPSDSEGLLEALGDLAQDLS